MLDYVIIALTGITGILAVFLKTIKEKTTNPNIHTLTKPGMFVTGILCVLLALSLSKQFHSDKEQSSKDSLASAEKHLADSLLKLSQAKVDSLLLESQTKADSLLTAVTTINNMDAAQKEAYLKQIELSVNQKELAEKQESSLKLTVDLNDRLIKKIDDQIEKDDQFRFPIESLGFIYKIKFKGGQEETKVYRNRLLAADYDMSEQLKLFESGRQPKDKDGESGLFTFLRFFSPKIYLSVDKDIRNSNSANFEIEPSTVFPDTITQFFMYTQPKDEFSFLVQCKSPKIWNKGNVDGIINLKGKFVTVELSKIEDIEYEFESLIFMHPTLGKFEPSFSRVNGKKGENIYTSKLDNIKFIKTGY